MTHLEPTTSLTLEDLATAITTAEEVASLTLSVQLASQVMTPNPSAFPGHEALGHLPIRDVMILEQLWQKAYTAANNQTETTLSPTWSNFLELLTRLLIQANQQQATLKLPYHVTGEQSAELTQLMKTKTQSVVFLDTVFSPEIRLGCILEYAGQRFDFTHDDWLKPYLDQALPTLKSSSTSTHAT